MNRCILLLGAKNTTDPLDSVPKELNRIKRFAEGKSDYVVEYEPYLTRDGLSELLRKHLDQIGILHFAGHSNDQSLKANDSVLPAKKIAAYLGTWGSKPSLLFLNGCSNSGQVKEFHKAGISCVIATRKPIADNSASEFAFEFYSELFAWPDKTNIAKAFERAGHLMLESCNIAFRSIDLEEIVEENTEWDWGIYSNPDMPDAENILKASDILGNIEIKKQASTGLPDGLDFIKQQKYQRAIKRVERLNEIIAGLEKDYEITIDSEAKYRLESRLKTRNQELSDVEIEIENLLVK